MSEITVRDLRNHGGAVLDRVARGEALTVTRDGRSVDGKSLLGLLLLAASCNSVISISAEGPDEDAAAEALARLVESGFGEAM